MIFMLYVNNEFECFIRGSKHEKTVCFIVFECLVPLMEHEKRVVYTTPQTKTFHWLFNLLSANGGPMKVICFVFVINGDKYSTSCFCKLISIVRCKTEMCRACRIYYGP